MSYKYYNYTDLGIVGAKKPINTHAIWELTNGTIVVADSGNLRVLYYSSDKGEIYSVMGGNTTRDIEIGTYSTALNRIYLTCNSGGDANISYANLATNFIHSVSGFSDQHAIDTVEYDNKVYTMLEWEVGGNLWFNLYEVYPALNLDDQVNLGAIGGRTYADTTIIVVGNEFYFLFQWSDGNTLIYKYNFTLTSFTMLEDCGANTSIFNLGFDQKGFSYDGSDILYFVLEDTGDSKKYLYSYIISTDTLTKGAEINISLMLNRNVHGTTLPFTLEKGFHITEDKIYQIPANYTGKVNLISVFNFTNTIIGITDHFVIDSGGKIYEIVDKAAYIFEGWIFTSRNSFSYFEMKFNSDYITIVTQLFIQIIGPYTVDGSTTADQVVFEGITVKPTKGRVQFVLVVNQSSEMDKVKPRGNKSGRSDQIISDINDDGAPDGPTYIKDGTLANGGAMGMLDLSGAKIYRTVLNDFAEHDAFLWSLRPQGALDYNDGSVDSGADIRNDISNYTDVIVGLKAWTIAKLNQIIVNGAINPITGTPYTGKWDDEEDQLANGINPITIEDSQLNSNALCQAKADTMGGNEAVRTRARFKFRKTTYGIIQVGQTITFLYDITDYITIAQAQFILDKFRMNIKTEVGYAEISSGL